MIKAIEILNEDISSEACLDDGNSDNVMAELDSIGIANIYLVRCAAHTLQLCVNDVNKQEEIAHKIDACRQLCKLLRTGQHRYVVFNLNSIKLDYLILFNYY